MIIDNIDLGKKVLIIAEVGNNHEGNFELAKQMIDQAAESGADAIKFQTFKADRYVTKKDEKRFQQLKGFELSYDQFRELASLAKKRSLIFLSTPFDLESVDALDPYVPAFKIASGDNTFLPLIKRIAQKKKPVIISTGTADQEVIATALETLKEYGQSKPLKDWVMLLHCVSNYPAKPEELNLLSIRYLQDKFDLTVGYSDHSLGIAASIVAVSCGARVIEKHFTYKKEDQSFRDHLLSADPGEFKSMVEGIRGIEILLGQYKKEPTDAEEKIKRIVRRGIAVNRLVKKGELIEEKDIIWLRPSGEFKPGQEDLVIGKKARRDLEESKILEKDDIA